MTFQFIQYDVANGYATITLNRPEKRNALSMSLLGELNAALWEADDDKEVNAVLIKGAGKDFSTGYDLTPEVVTSVRPKLRQSTYRRGGLYEDDYATLSDDAWRLEFSQRLRMAIFDMHKPVVARIHGNCLAGGTDVALLCDMLIAADDARIGHPAAVDVGTTPNSMWLYHVGPQWAKRMMLTGDTISGADAAKAGLVMKSVPAELLDAEVEGLMRKLGKIDSDALRAGKRIINLGLELMGARTLQRLAAENDAQLHTAQVTREFRELVKAEGLNAALAKRRASFPDAQVRFDRPELRDETGRFLDEGT
ncbi:crotonase/enoyl-CoA hydratase family protein [Novosphingobium sp. PASSN1]|uniref:crotonase/enoyl-CoA hydratase family protein n=1 Tax=Novosphingobium sp. PASSN1 TaxID=2015561 RepID=UPI000BC41B83|nr:crotonase/enoyl-CoA hydratase family protein [Novosphingobium sp. PASSN1]OYU34799.1 MAG: enoyl-CoA hydratase [Novosphingobium sp. PASSN1]